MPLPSVEALEPRQLWCLTHAPLAELSSLRAPSEPPPVQLSFSTAKAMPQRREEGASAVLAGKLYVFGGFYDGTFTGTGRTDRYDPTTDSWSQRASMPEPITHASAVVIDGEAWLFGGYVGKDPGPATQKVYIYNPTTNSWRRGPDMPAPRGAGAAVRIDRTVYYFGGRNATRTHDVAETWALNLDTGNWSVRASLPNPRNHIAGAAWGGSVFAIGGQWHEASLAQNQRTVNRFDPQTNTWTTLAELPVAMSHSTASTFEYQGRLLVIGGETAHNVSTAGVWAYDPRSNSWQSWGQLPDARRAPQAGIIDGRVYVAGGSLRGAQKNDVFVANLPTAQALAMPTRSVIDLRPAASYDGSGSTDRSGGDGSALDRFA